MTTFTHPVSYFEPTAEEGEAYKSEVQAKRPNAELFCGKTRGGRPNPFTIESDGHVLGASLSSGREAWQAAAIFLLDRG